MSTAEQAAVAAARAGDDRAFAGLIAAARPQARGVVRRLIGHPDDCDDILQEAALKAWRSIASFRGRSGFTTWYVAIATREAVEHLRTRKRWRTEAQIAFANLCASSEELAGEIGTAFAAPDFSYEVREHVTYCFTCVGRSLPADEQAALVLRDVCEMSSREAATALGTTESVLGHRLAAARAAMIDKYEGLCALVSKTGMCHQCEGLRAAAPDARRGGPLPDVATLVERLRVVRSVDPDTGRSRGLHDIFWRRTTESEEAGAGSTDPGECAAG